MSLLRIFSISFDSLKLELVTFFEEKSADL